MKIDGGCHCGFITYEAEADPERAAICNCTDCQNLSGSAFRTFLPVPDESFSLLSGEPAIYVKTGDSGEKREQTFCPKCGSAIYSTAIGAGPKDLNIRLGTARQRNQLVPKAKIWTRSELPWLDQIGTIPGIDKQ